MPLIFAERGGDKAGSFNISTFVSFILAAGGVPVIKHGNRSISSKCGSADLLEAIGIPLQANSDILRAGLEELNFAFLFCSCIPSCIQALPQFAKFSRGWHHHDLQSFGTNTQPSKTQTSFSSFPKDTWKRWGMLQENGTENGMIVHGRISNDKITGVDELTACGNNKVLDLEFTNPRCQRKPQGGIKKNSISGFERGQLGRKFIHYAKSSFSRLPARFMGDHNDQCCHSLCALRQIFQPEDGNEYTRHLEKWKVSQWLERSREILFQKIENLK